MICSRNKCPFFYFSIIVQFTLLCGEQVYECTYCVFSYWLDADFLEDSDVFLCTSRCEYFDANYEYVWVHACICALSSSGGGYRHAAVPARVPPEPLPPPHPGQRLPERQAAPRHVHARGEPRCSPSQTHQVPLEEHHPRRVS